MTELTTIGALLLLLRALDAAPVQETVQSQSNNDVQNHQNQVDTSTLNAQNSLVACIGRQGSHLEFIPCEHASANPAIMSALSTDNQAADKSSAAQKADSAGQTRHMCHDEHRCFHASVDLAQVASVACPGAARDDHGILPPMIYVPGLHMGRDSGLMEKIGGMMGVDMGQEGVVERDVVSKSAADEMGVDMQSREKQRQGRAVEMPACGMDMGGAEQSGGQMAADMAGQQQQDCSSNQSRGSNIRTRAQGEQQSSQSQESRVNQQDRVDAQNMVNSQNHEDRETTSSSTANAAGKTALQVGMPGKQCRQNQQDVAEKVAAMKDMAKQDHEQRVEGQVADQDNASKEPNSA